jgi:hypothetical protein
MKFLVNLFFLLFFFFTFSQEKYEYFGALKLNGNDKTVISYRLVFYENNGKLSGYSVTDLGGAHETKNTISGNYNGKTKAINFKEESILYTKSPLSSSTFCFVNFTGKIKLENESSKLTGNFNGLYQNKKKCIDGTLLLIGSNKLVKFFNKVNKKLQKSNRVDDVTKRKVNPLRIMDSLKVNNLIKDQNLTVFTKYNVMELVLWDSEVEDGDIINVYNNDVLILKEFHLVNKRKKINVSIEKGKNIFRIEAVSEGDLKPNTTTIQIIDSDRTFDLVSSLKKSESASITIMKQED